MRGKNPKERLQNAVQKSSELADTFTDRLEQSWRVVLAGAALILSISLLLLWVAFAHPFDSSGQPPEITVPEHQGAASGFARALDGVYVDTSTSTHLLPIAVMVENSMDAWPLMGPAKANVVVEAPVEGSITRFMLLFDPSNDADTIGPVRSARPYYVEWADGLDAMYAHVGGSPAALSEIQGIDGFRNLDEFANGGSFRRSDSRAAPHNVFTSTASLLEAMERKAYEAGTFRSWLYEDGVREDQEKEEGASDQNEPASEASAEEPEVSHISVPYQGVYEAFWEYDSETGLYTRSQNGTVQKDADGTVVRARNVVVMQTYATVVDREGRLNLRTTGRGTAIIFHDGKRYTGEWKRDAGEHIRFETVDGRDIPFARGNTWISVLTSWSAMNQVLE